MTLIKIMIIIHFIQHHLQSFRVAEISSALNLYRPADLKVKFATTKN